MKSRCSKTLNLNDRKRFDYLSIFKSLEYFSYTDYLNLTQVELKTKIYSKMCFYLTKIRLLPDYLET